MFARGIHGAGEGFDLAEIKLGARIVEEGLQAVARKSHAAALFAEVVRGAEGLLAATRTRQLQGIQQRHFEIDLADVGAAFLPGKETVFK